jgi:hypothetical protein
MALDHYLGSHPLLTFSDPLNGLSYSLTSASKRHLAPIYICTYHSYLEFRKLSFSVILYGCNDQVS